MSKEQLTAIFDCLACFIICLVGIVVGVFCSCVGFYGMYYWGSSAVRNESELLKLVETIVTFLMAFGGIVIIAKSMICFVKGVKSGEFTAAKVVERHERAKKLKDRIENEAKRDLDFLRSLLPEVGPESCRISDCNHKRISSTKLCAKHQFELHKNKSCPWEISPDGHKVKE